MMKLDRVIPFAGLALAACAPAATEHPNVIYVFPDQFRNASLGFWSDPEYAEQVARPARSRWSRRMQALAVSSFSTTMFWSPAPRAVSMATA